MTLINFKGGPLSGKGTLVCINWIKSGTSLYRLIVKGSGIPVEYKYQGEVIDIKKEDVK